MIHDALLKVDVLLRQKRYKEAEKILKDLLREQPDDALTLEVLAEVKCEQGDLDEAEKMINASISLMPNSSSSFYTRAKIYLRKDKYDKAEEDIKQAVELDSSDADYFSLWALIHINKKDYKLGLEMANKSLELDAENITGLNIRSIALTKLNNNEEAHDTAQAALKESPNNAFTHSIYGWNLLESGKHKEALHHFRESLQLDPSLDHSREGMAEALKAKYIPYRLFLKYSFWLGNLKAGYRWAVIIGFYFAFKFLRIINENTPELQPLLVPVIFLLGFLVFGTWIVTPITNLILRMSSYGKHLLDSKEIQSANLVGISLILSIIGFVGYFFTSGLGFMIMGGASLMMVLPLGNMFTSEKYKKAPVIYTAIMGFIGIAGTIMAFATGKILSIFLYPFLFMFVCFSWGMNYINNKE